MDSGGNWLCRPFVPEIASPNDRPLVTGYCHCAVHLGRRLVAALLASAAGCRAHALTLRLGEVERPKPARSLANVPRRRILWVIGRWPSIFGRIWGHARVPVAVF
jgi:hypothetical protein